MIRLDAGGRRTDEMWRAVRIEHIGARNELDQASNDRIRRGGALGVRQDQAVEIEPLALPQALIGSEEKHLFRDERTTKRSAKLVPLEQVRFGCELEIVRRVESIIPQELERVAMKLVATRS